jgi:ketosteroid isomerase-like protein
MFAHRSLCLAAALACGAPAAAAPDDTAPIRRVLDEQVAAWNRKDLEGYMAGYWKSPELTFFGGGAVTRGWQATLDRYRQRYQGEGKEMGTLSFGELTVEKLGPEAAVARGEWRLKMSDGKAPHGLFTVIFRRFPEGWRIVHDHSSSA